MKLSWAGIRWFAACLGFALCCLLLSGCGGEGSRSDSPRPPVEIRYWTGWSGYELRAQKAIIQEFERDHPHIKVRLTSVASSYDKVRLAFASGSPPDVMSCVWGDEVPIYSMRGLLEPLDDYLRESGRKVEEWIPACARMGTYEGRVYALAATTNCRLIAYNKKTVRGAGLDPDSPPTNTVELAKWHKALTVLKDGEYKRIGFIPQSLELWAYAFGGRWYDESTGRVTADHPGNIAALKWMAGWTKAGNPLALQRFEQTAAGSIISANGPFILGRLAMVGTGDWFGGLMKQFGDDIEWGYVGVNGPPGVLPRNVADVNGSVFVIPAASKHKAEAWEFLNWFCGPAGSYRFCSAISNLPALREVQEKPPFSTDPFLKFCAEISRGEGAIPPPSMPIWPQFKQELIRVEDHALRGGADPETLLKTLQKSMSEELERTLETKPGQEK